MNQSKEEIIPEFIEEIIKNEMKLNEPIKINLKEIVDISTINKELDIYLNTKFICELFLKDKELNLMFSSDVITKSWIKGVNKTLPEGGNREMKHLIIIPSFIHNPLINSPSIRDVLRTHNENYLTTLELIKNIRSNTPNGYILLIESGVIFEEEFRELIKYVDEIFIPDEVDRLNFYHNPNISEIGSIYKSLINKEDIVRNYEFLIKFTPNEILNVCINKLENKEHLIFFNKNNYSINKELIDYYIKRLRYVYKMMILNENKSNILFGDLV